MAQALADGNMGPGEELTPEEEEQLQYPEDEGQQDTLEQASTTHLGRSYHTMRVLAQPFTQ